MLIPGLEAFKSHSWRNHEGDKWRRYFVLGLGLPVIHCLPVPSLHYCCTFKKHWTSCACSVIRWVHPFTLTKESQRVLLYDPVFTEEDVMGLKELGLQVLSEASESHYTSTTPRLLFLPHCELWLYEAIVWANWSAEGLASLFMISNRFHTYSNHRLSNEMRANYPCVEKLTPVLKCVSFPLAPTLETAFTELSLQFVEISENPIPPKDHGFWTLPQSVKKSKHPVIAWFTAPCADHRTCLS